MSAKDKTGTRKIPLSLFLILALLMSSLIMAPAFVSAAPEMVPAVGLPNLLDAGQKISLDDFRGKVVLLNLWASWCPGCLDEMPELIALQEHFGKDSFTVVGVSIDNKRANAISFLERVSSRFDKQVNFPVLHDKDKRFIRSLNPLLMPTSYLIDPLGRIISIFPGSITEKTVPGIRLAIEKEIKVNP